MKKNGCGEKVLLLSFHSLTNYMRELMKCEKKLFLIHEKKKKNFYETKKHIWRLFSLFIVVFLPILKKELFFF